MNSKKIIILTAFAISLTACMDKITESIQPKAIDFRIVETRGTETRIENFESFEATSLYSDGRDFFKDIEFFKTGVYYNSFEEYYWPSEDEIMKFYAWSPHKDKLPGIVAINGTDAKVYNFSPDADITKHIDFLSAHTAANQKGSSTGVVLDFNHNLSQIEIKAKSSHEGYKIKITGISLNNLIGKGDFDFESSKWSYSDVKTDYIVEFDAAREILETPVCLMLSEGNNAMVIPQTLIGWDAINDKTNTQHGSYLGVKIQISSKEGTRIFPIVGDYDWMGIPLSGELKAGTKYTYTIDYKVGSGYVSPDKTPPTGEDFDIFYPGDEIYGQMIIIDSSTTNWDSE